MKRPEFSDEEHKIAALAADIWKAKLDTSKDGPTADDVAQAFRLLTMSRDHLHSLSITKTIVNSNAGRVPFEELLNEDQKKETNVPRTLGRITTRKALVSKIKQVFPPLKVFKEIEKLSWEDKLSDDERSAPDVVSEALNRLEVNVPQMSQAQLYNFFHLYKHQLGFSGSSDQYPYEANPEHNGARLFRSCEDICKSGWFSHLEIEVISAEK